MYSEIIMQLHKNPLNKKKIKDYTIKVNAGNPHCGDEIELFLKIKKNIVVDAGFLGRGCAISTAGNSMLTEKIKGKTINWLKKLNKETVLSWFGSIIKSRQKCALLAFLALKNGLEEFKGKKISIKVVI